MTSLPSYVTAPLQPLSDLDKVADLDKLAESEVDAIDFYHTMLLKNHGYGMQIEQRHWILASGRYNCTNSGIAS